MILPKGSPTKLFSMLSSVIPLAITITTTTSVPPKNQARCRAILGVVGKNYSALIIALFCPTQKSRDRLRRVQCENPGPVNAKVVIIHMQTSASACLDISTIYVYRTQAFCYSRCQDFTTRNYL